MNSSRAGILSTRTAVTADHAHMRVIRIMLFIVFTAAGAQISVRLPYSPVPFTMQTLFVVMAGMVLGPRDGFYAMIGYLSAGLAGMPVFAGFSFGPAAFLGPTGGYLLAFPAAALIAGWIGGLPIRGWIRYFAGSFVGTAAILAVGTLYLALIMGLDLSRALAYGFVPFLAGDLIKSAAAAILAGRRA